MDEFNWPLLGAEGTNRTYEHDELEPDTIYKVVHTIYNVVQVNKMLLILNQLL